MAENALAAGVIVFYFAAALFCYGLVLPGESAWVFRVWFTGVFLVVWVFRYGLGVQWRSVLTREIRRAQERAAARPPATLAEANSRVVAATRARDQAHAAFAARPSPATRGALDDADRVEEVARRDRHALSQRVAAEQARALVTDAVRHGPGQAR